MLMPFASAFLMGKIVHFADRNRAFSHEAEVYALVCRYQWLISLASAMHTHAKYFAA